MSWWNLKLTITWDSDNDKLAALIKLLNLPWYKEAKSILIYATYKYKTYYIAKYLWDHGIEAKEYNAGL